MIYRILTRLDAEQIVMSRPTFTRLIVAIVAIVAITSVTGCADGGRFMNRLNGAIAASAGTPMTSAPARVPQPPNYVNPFAPGVTTEKGVVVLFGEPRNSLKLADGRWVLRYRIGDLLHVHPLGAPHKILHLVHLLRESIDTVRSAGRDCGQAANLGFASGLEQAGAPHMLTPVPFGQALSMGSQAAQQAAQQCEDTAQATDAQLIPQIHELARLNVLIGFDANGKFINYVIAR